jgi:hypothetical protein
MSSPSGRYCLSSPFVFSFQLTVPGGAADHPLWEPVLLGELFSRRTRCR